MKSILSYYNKHKENIILYNSDCSSQITNQVYLKIGKNNHSVQEFTDLDNSKCLLVSDCILLTGKSVLSIPVFIQPSKSSPTTITPSDTSIESFLQWLSQTESFYTMKILTVDEYPSQIKAPISFTRIIFFFVIFFILYY